MRPSEGGVVVLGRGGQPGERVARGRPVACAAPRPPTPTAGSPRPGTGTRRPAAPGSPAGRRTSCPAWPAWRGCAATAGRKPYSGRPASAGSSRPTTRIAELATIRRSTSLAVCCAPIRMMPSDRPRSAMSSSTSLIGLDALPRRVLVQLVEHVNSSPPAPGRLLARGLGREHDADHEPLGALVQVVQVDDGDLLALRWSPAGAGVSGRSPRMMRAQRLAATSAAGGGTR